MVALEVVQPRDQPARRERRQHADRQRAPALALVGLGKGLFDQRQAQRELGVQRVAGLGQRHAASRAHEQLRLQARLQTPHVMADRAGGQAQFIGRAREAGQPRGRLEGTNGLQRWQLHR